MPDNHAIPSTRPDMASAPAKTVSTHPEIASMHTETVSTPVDTASTPAEAVSAHYDMASARPNVAVILAGGTGRRMGLELPKQFLPLAGRTVLERTVDAFERNACIAEILIVAHPRHVEDTEAVVRRNTWTKVSRVLAGGKERYDSSLAAIRACEGRDVNLLLHDAVRPLVSDRIIGGVCALMQHEEAVVTAVPAVDTIYELAPDGTIGRIPDRSQLRRAQTPQAFRLHVIAEAYRRAFADKDFRATDDCGVMARYMPEVAIRIAEGEERNLKLTYREDIALAERLLTAESY